MDTESFYNIDTLMPGGAHISLEIWGIIGSGNGVLPVWHKATTSTNTEFLLLGPLGTN